MRKLVFFFYILVCYSAAAQVDSSSNNLMNELDNKPAATSGKPPVKVFYSERLINANTVEVISKGHLQFKVVHNFGDIGGTFGGIKNAYGLDNATDIKIGFVLGLAKNLNMMVSRNKGFGQVLQLWEMGFKYKFLEQRENDPSHPLSAAVFVNGVISSQKADTNTVNIRENHYTKGSDRQSQVLQLMVARRFGKVLSFQLNPTLVHTNFVVPGDQKSIFAMGAGLRVPIYKRFVFIADYFHAFRSQSSIDALKAKGVRLYDALGVGLELLTPGHVFHVNFTNTHSILENRFIPRTTTSWGKGEYRWGFTVTRNFVLFRDKRKAN
ncbi:MAG TPA: DUF5777 family beta-barrel protein [Ferruginibacter sp.]|nr:DUF5777 family beta-barrel protein [Ferruginibacter sp.]